MGVSKLCDWFLFPILQRLTKMKIIPTLFVRLEDSIIQYRLGLIFCN